MIKTQKIVICGGHFSPAIALIEELKKRQGFEIHYIGRTRAFEGDKTPAFESNILHQMSIPFHPVTTGRLERYLSLSGIISLFKLPLGFGQSIYYLWSLKPDVVMSFGGYVALPVSIAAWILGIGVITHEQTPVLGLSNRIICRFAKYLCLTWKDTAKVPASITPIITGNPIRQDIFYPEKNGYRHPGNSALPLIYITGGSLGSQVINETVSKILPQLVNQFRLIHQCGEANENKDYDSLCQLKNSLPAKSKKNYQLVKHLDPGKVGEVMHQSTLIIGRAGANTIAEIAVSKTPSILIPLPWAADNEQEDNASILVRTGSALIIKQEELTAEKLLQNINYLFSHLDSFRKNAANSEKFFPKDAAEKIADLLA